MAILQQIICGAWNFDEGAVVPVAVPGAVLPGGFEIGTRAIRGVESHGMICSERELGLGEMHEGIMVLDPATPLGVPFESTLELPDVVFELEITNNRPDVMGMVGVARELAAWFDVEYRTPDVSLVTVPGKPATEVTISAPDGCNRFVARELVDVEVRPSPLWMRERLRKAGVRAISNVVDVSNYVMLEMGHPLHAFDAAQIAGDTLEVRWAAAGETLVTLDDVERKLIGDDLVIVDAEGPTSLAAVMGGARSEVSEGTTRVLMEAASWNPATVMYTSRRHDLRSEASSRFERGIDPNLAPDADDRACKLLAEISGASILDGVIDVIVPTRQNHGPCRYQSRRRNASSTTGSRWIGPPPCCDGWVLTWLSMETPWPSPFLPTAGISLDRPTSSRNSPGWPISTRSLPPSRPALPVA